MSMQFGPRTGALIVAACAAFALPVQAQSVVPAAQPACSAPSELANVDHKLDHVHLRIAQGRPIKIVAIGSSSTSGSGATSWAATYPSRLQAELNRLLPGAVITVINRGIGGEEAAQMVARFEADVIDERPDLVLWQVGSNSVLRDHPTPAQLILDGVERLKATGADVILVNAQYAPKIITKPGIEHSLDVIAATARDAEVGLFDRFALMRHWRETLGIPFEAFLSPDGLHMNDWSYACVAKVLADAITDGARLPVATARMPPASPTR